MVKYLTLILIICFVLGENSIKKSQLCVHSELISRSSSSQKSLANRFDEIDNGAINRTKLSISHSSNNNNSSVKDSNNEHRHRYNRHYRRHIDDNQHHRNHRRRHYLQPPDDDNNNVDINYKDNLPIDVVIDKPLIQDSSSITDIGIKCPKCTNTINKVEVSEEELIELRIDFVKRQILQKLRLKHKPQLDNMNLNLPKPIIEREYYYQNSKPKENLDDYYARTSKKFIILKKETRECLRFNKNPSICFSFKIDDVDIDSIDVNQAVLWLYKTGNHKDRMKQTLVVSEIDQQYNSKYLPKIKPIAMTSVGVDEGWIKIDIAWPIRKWVGYHELSHFIHISCESCELDGGDEGGSGLIATENEYQPFIVIDTQYRRRARHRQKRNVNCTAGITECCREKLFISFKEIGWNDWIIQPAGYDAYFCRGSCSSAASIAASNNHHTAFIQKLAQHRESKNGKKPLELIPCCTAKQFSSLQLFYRDSNNTVTLKTLPNMVVESCGCM